MVRVSTPLRIRWPGTVCLPIRTVNPEHNAPWCADGTNAQDWKEPQYGEEDLHPGGALLTEAWVCLLVVQSKTNGAVNGWKFLNNTGISSLALVSRQILPWDHWPWAYTFDDVCRLHPTLEASVATKMMRGGCVHRIWEARSVGSSHHRNREQRWVGKGTNYSQSPKERRCCLQMWDSRDKFSPIKAPLLHTVVEKAKETPSSIRDGSC